MMHIVLISGGLASFEAAKRVIEKYGREETELWFFDTLIEDDDLYRFLRDCEEFLSKRITWFVEGRTPWEVFRDKRFIGNSRVDVCSRLIKREFLERLLSSKFDPNSIILYFGLEWSEGHRISRVQEAWKTRGYDVEFPLSWDPILMPSEFQDLISSYGIQIPRLYSLGFPHNNCGGACIKAGIKQWTLLWKTFPQRYLWHEVNEQEIRRLLGKNVSILRNRRNGNTKPMTLRYLRWRLKERLKEDGSIDDYLRSLPDSWPCSCFVGSVNESLRLEDVNHGEN